VTTTINQYRQWIDQLLSQGKTVQVPVYGMSMFPILMPGDKVQVRRVGVQDMRVGQVLVFENQGQWVAHRLIAKQEDGKLITKGDGQPWKDNPVAPESAKGIIIKVIKTRSPLAWSINTRMDRFFVWTGPVVGRVFGYAGRVVGKVVRVIG
jgi:signal peptidase I